MNSNNNNQNIIYQELIKNQRKDLTLEKKLKLSDLKRISSYLSTSIFGNNCSIWNGYITEFKNNSHYINFYFNGKKHALHRLLYYNFIGEIEENEYLKYKCVNKGRCCCIEHFEKVNSNEKHINLPQIDISKNTIENDSESETLSISKYKKITVEL
jgi:hypothetical protein